MIPLVEVLQRTERFFRQKGIPSPRLHELTRRTGRYRMYTLCVGGGPGLAALSERV